MNGGGSFGCIVSPDDAVCLRLNASRQVGDPVTCQRHDPPFADHIHTL